MKTARFKFEDYATLRQKLLFWAGHFELACVLDSCQTNIDRYGEYDLLIGVALPDTRCIDTWAALDNYHNRTAEGENRRWLFGGLNYRLKDKFETSLSSNLPTAVAFPELCLFEAEIEVRIVQGQQEVEICAEANPKCIWEQINALEPVEWPVLPQLQFHSKFSRQDYINTVARLREHIREGDVYEINLSQPFTATGKLDSPTAVFEQLTMISPVPFAGYFRWKQKYLICASPERFLQHRSGMLTSQPIKGTAAREKGDPKKDACNQAELQASEKERAENVMIVDLVRNDLHRSCEAGSVTVPHLFELQTFPKVHHLVSTVQGELREGLDLLTALRHAYPPGSMTGAPKVSAMQLIERYERAARELYAGSIGYIAPSGDFDFNVVIRSFSYDAQTHLISYNMGGAITWDSDPVAEYEETLIKARAIRQLFGEQAVQLR